MSTSSQEPPPNIRVSITTLFHSSKPIRIPIRRSRLRQAVRLLLSQYVQQPAEVSICLCDDPSIRLLNARYRQVDEPTDVLSFPQLEGGLPSKMPYPLLLGDVLISIETAQRQAEQNHHSVEVECLMLCLHGVLHLLGYDDRTPKQRSEMNRLAIRTLRALGYSIEEEWSSRHYER